MRKDDVALPVRSTKKGRSVGGNFPNINRQCISTNQAKCPEMLTDGDSVGWKAFYFRRYVLDDDRNYTKLVFEQFEDLDNRANLYQRSIGSSKARPGPRLKLFMEDISIKTNIYIRDFFMQEEPKTYLTNKYFSTGLSYTGNKHHQLRNKSRGIPIYLYECRPELVSKYRDKCDRNMLPNQVKCIEEDFVLREFEEYFELRTGTVYFFYTVSHSLITVEHKDPPYEEYMDATSYDLDHGSSHFSSPFATPCIANPAQSGEYILGRPHSRYGASSIRDPMSVVEATMDTNEDDVHDIDGCHPPGPQDYVKCEIIGQRQAEASPQPPSETSDDEVQVLTDFRNDRGSISGQQSTHHDSSGHPEQQVDPQPSTSLQDLTDRTGELATATKQTRVEESTPNRQRTLYTSSRQHDEGLPVSQQPQHGIKTEVTQPKSTNFLSYAIHASGALTQTYQIQHPYRQNQTDFSQGIRSGVTNFTRKSSMQYANQSNRGSIHAAAVTESLQESQLNRDVGTTTMSEITASKCGGRPIERPDQQDSEQSGARYRDLLKRYQDLSQDHERIVLENSELKKKIKLTVNILRSESSD